MRHEVTNSVGRRAILLSIGAFLTALPGHAAGLEVPIMATFQHADRIPRLFLSPGTSTWSIGSTVSVSVTRSSEPEGLTVTVNYE